MYVYMYLIQIHFSEPILTRLCTRLPLGLEETVGYVWPEILNLFDLWALFLWGHCRIMGTR
jgi:hypothetical protein